LPTLLSSANTVIGNIKKDNNNPRDSVNPSSYLTNNCNSTFPRTGTTPHLVKMTRLPNSKRLKTHTIMMKSPEKFQN